MRESGILMPVSSLPGPYGIGCFGKEAFKFVDFLAQAGQKIWQILPLSPTGYGDSPYQSCSAFAGNPYFIDLDALKEEGLLTAAQLKAEKWGTDPKEVDYGTLYVSRFKVLRTAYAAWRKQCAGLHGCSYYFPDDYYAFTLANEEWLDDYALYMACKRHFGMRSWTEWEDADIRLRKSPEVLERYRTLLREDVELFTYLQFLFFRQWNKLRDYLHGLDIQVIGDLPIYVAMDSADVWAEPENFQLDDRCVPTEVSGVPPDYFSADGQLWGNPLYDWDAMESDGFSWWEGRIRAALDMYDVIRLDHFRGFEAYWEVPFSSPDSSYGSWTQGPGLKFFKTLEEKLGTLPIIAEDLGFLTPGVIDMRDNSGFPGMKILQFAFEGTNSYYLPHNYIANTVAYVGTHDNETARGWFEGTATPRQREQAALYTHQQAGEPMADALNRTIAASVSDTCIYTMQDLLNLGNEARINTPATLGGNWTWRMLDGAITRELEHKLTDWTETYFRIPSEAEIELPQ